MNEAVFVSSIGMLVSMIGISVVCIVAGALLYVCENIAGKRRSEAH